MGVPFTRTTCSCAKCVQCCKRHPGYMVPGDLERIAEHIGEQDTPAFALRFFRASPGAIVQAGARQFRIGTIIPATDKTGRCVFLGDDDRCAIHQVAPFGCAYFDTHMDSRTSQMRSAWGLRLVQTSQAYQEQRRQLRPTSSYRPTPI